MRAALIIAVSLLLSRMAAADDTRLVPGEILEGEVARLIIETDHRIATLNAIDTTPLQRDFRVLDVDSRVTRMLDGQERPFHRAQWRIQIAPRRGGRLEVPALAVGDRRSKPMVLVVRPVPALQNRHEALIEVEVAPETPYLGQEVRVTTRVLHSSAFDWARLAEPKSDEVARYQHGGDRRYSVERDGREYRVLERTQSLFPRRPGRLALGEAEFRGRLGNGTGFDDRWLHRHVEAPVIHVREPPAGRAGAPWLPARRVDLALEWAQQASAPVPGQPIDFTLTLTAGGLAAEFLPAGLLARAGDGFNVFPDREQREDLLAGDALVGRLVQRYVLVASRAGEITLPGITLDWWDTEADGPRQAAVAPARLVIAEPPAAVAASAARVKPLPTGIGYGLATVVGLSALIAWRFRRHHGLARRIVRWRETRRCLGRLRRACRAGEPDAAQAALAEWRRLTPQAPRSAALWAAQRDLDAALYAARAAPWRGDALWEAVRDSARAGGDSAPAPAAGGRALPGLYPARERQAGADV